MKTQGYDDIDLGVDEVEDLVQGGDDVDDEDEEVQACDCGHAFAQHAGFGRGCDARGCLCPRYQTKELQNGTQ